MSILKIVSVWRNSSIQLGKLDGKIGYVTNEC